jgi:hypothetical protein
LGYDQAKRAAARHRNNRPGPLARCVPLGRFPISIPETSRLGVAYHELQHPGRAELDHRYHRHRTQSGHPSSGTTALTCITPPFEISRGGIFVPRRRSTRYYFHCSLTERLVESRGGDGLMATPFASDVLMRLGPGTSCARGSFYPTYSSAHQAAKARCGIFYYPK